MEIQGYANELVTSCSGVSDIWLLGSRANGTARIDSDWDLLIFGNASALACIKASARFHRVDVDCLVVTDGNTFETACGPRKAGSLKSWDWEQHSTMRASYTQAKWTGREGATGVVSRPGRALRVWPTNEHAL